MSNKNSLKLALLFVLLVSCRKEVIPSTDPCRGIAYLIDRTDVSGKVIKTDTSIVWPCVCGEALQRFMGLSKDPEPLCGLPGCYIRLVIFKIGSK